MFCQTSLYPGLVYLFILYLFIIVQTDMHNSK